MELTQFVVSRRNDALAVGDYGTYRKSLSRRILTLRKRLGRTTAKGRKYTPKASISPEDVAANEEFVHLQILTAERAWAHAMYMKSMRSNDTDQAITGSTKTHILSRLEKSRKAAVSLAKVLDHSESSDETRLLLEAQAYQSLICGALFFEARKWSQCLEEYSITYTVYSNLAKATGKRTEAFQELLSNTIEPSVRYAAYQLKIPRTSSTPQIVSKHLKRNSPPIQTLLKIDSTCLDEEKPTKGQPDEDRELPTTIIWRTRQVPIEDAAIAEAIADTRKAETKLADTTSSLHLSAKEKAAAYDDVLVPSQDAVDAAKTAIDELIAEGVPPADKRLQALQVTRTALNYDLISWRVGRYRILCGENDGIDVDSTGKKNKSDTTSSKIAGLREKLVLYDSIVQSIESINELPGVAADQVLGKELSSKKAYFLALRSITIARSHALQGDSKNALALFVSAAKNASHVSSSEMHDSNGKALGLEVTQKQAEHLQRSTKSLVAQHHALVEIHRITQEEIRAEKGRRLGATPLIERLHEYPVGEVDMANLVDYPPRIKAIPVKPIFLDVAWNYIQYPGKSQAASQKEESVKNKQQHQQQLPEPQQQEKKRGWFGFSR